MRKSQKKFNPSFSFVAGAKRQEELKKQHNIENSDVVVVEKNNMTKWTVTKFIQLLKFIATVIILILACIGLYSLLHPEIRGEILTALNDLTAQVRAMLN